MLFFYLTHLTRLSLYLQQLTDSLLEMEEEKAIWSAKEKASIGAIEEKTKIYGAEIMALSKEISEVTVKVPLVYMAYVPCEL